MVEIYDLITSISIRHAYSTRVLNANNTLFLYIRFKLQDFNVFEFFFFDFYYYLRFLYFKECGAYLLLEEFYCGKRGNVSFSLQLVDKSYNIIMSFNRIYIQRSIKTSLIAKNEHATKSVKLQSSILDTQ